MSVNDHWMYQGRQSHGWFGTGTAPKDGDDDAAGANELFSPSNASERVDAAAHLIIASAPRNERGRWSYAASDAGRDRLKTAVAAWYGASAMSRDVFRTQFLNPYTSDETVDRLRHAAQGLIEARSYDDLGEASSKLSAAARQIGPDRWPQFIGGAARQAEDAVSRGDVPGVIKANYATTAIGGVAVLGGLVIGGLFGGHVPSLPFGHRLSSPQPASPTVMQAVPVPPPKEGETPTDVLKPGGQNVGEVGDNSGVRILPGGDQEAQKLFDRLTKGGEDITPSGHPGKIVRMPDGSIISYRPTSKSGPPTIDVKVSGLAIRKLKFPGSEN